MQLTRRVANFQRAPRLRRLHVLVAHDVCFLLAIQRTYMMCKRSAQTVPAVLFVWKEEPKGGRDAAVSPSQKKNTAIALAAPHAGQTRDV